ncbi:MAG: glycosyltransferase, partial [Leptolyngbyaceae cyanobacterium CAN_BIN12]|nr:glycosyltransferase [Leptolyngbyaceae cyanobacterium CAN_BIN12]
CGLACVATDAGADGEVLEKEAGVILKTQGVATQLKILLPQLRDHTAWTSTLGINARRRAEERYTLSDNIAQVEKLYRELIILRSQSKQKTPQYLSHTSTRRSDSTFVRSKY